MLVSVEKEKSKFLLAIEESLRAAEEKERVHPATYRCPRCKDKKWFTWWKDGYEYGEPCECQEREWEEERRRRHEKDEKDNE